MHLERAHQHETRDAGRACGAGKRGGGRGLRLDPARVGRDRRVRAAGEMHDRTDAGEERLKVARLGQGSGDAYLDARPERKHGSRRGTNLDPARREPRRERPADEAAGAKDQDRTLIHGSPGAA